MNKCELRKKYQNLRKNLLKKDVVEKSKLISENFIQNLFPKLNIKNTSSFSLYIDSYNEVKTEFLKNFLIENNIDFSYPKISAKNKPLNFIKYEKNQKFTQNNFFKSILEPENGEEIYPDFIILPLVSFDCRNMRIGMGGGFFDRTIEFLKNKKNIVTIGLAYYEQRFEDKFITEKTDQNIDFIVTENYIFSQSQS